MDEKSGKNNLNFKHFFGTNKKPEDNSKANEENDTSKKDFMKAIGPSNFVIILMVGILLLIVSWPSGPKDKEDGARNQDKASNSVNEDIYTKYSNSKNQTEIYVNSLENRLEEALKKVEGIGDVEVMITLKGSKEVVVLKDEPFTDERVNESDREGGKRLTSNHVQEENTILVENADGTKAPYILREIEPQVEGILVIATGGKNIEIINQIIEATQVLFGVPAHKVKVMKMN